MHDFATCTLDFYRNWYTTKFLNSKLLLGIKNYIEKCIHYSFSLIFAHFRKFFIFFLSGQLWTAITFSKTHSQTCHVDHKIANTYAHLGRTFRGQTNGWISRKTNLKKVLAQLLRWPFMTSFPLRPNYS